MTNSNTSNYFSNKIKQIRNNNNMSLTEFAEKVGLPATTISRIESGDTAPNSSTLLKILNKFGYNLDITHVDNKTASIEDILDYLAYSLKNKLGDMYDMTNMKANKLMYFLQAVNFQVNDQPAFEESMHAYQYGPVSETVLTLVRKKIKTPTDVYPVPMDKPEIPDNIKKSIDKLLIELKVGDCSAYELMRISHNQNNGDNPWNNIYKESPMAKISNDSIKKYSAEILKDFPRK